MYINCRMDDISNAAGWQESRAVSMQMMISTPPKRFIFTSDTVA